MPSDTAYAVYEDRHGELWVGTYRGLAKFNRAGKCFVRYEPQPENPQSLSSNIVKTLLEDHRGILWIGTEGGGLNKFDREQETFVQYRRNSAPVASISGNFVNALYEDQAKNLWIGTSRGLNKFNLEGESFMSVLLLSCKDETTAPPKTSPTILGVWELAISIPPNSPGVANTLTFSGDVSSGTFVEKNSHGGPWSAIGDSICFEYKNVPSFPDLVNVFLGKTDAARASMSGTNSVMLNGAAFNGVWSGSKK